MQPHSDAVPVVAGLEGARASMDVKMAEARPPSKALLQATLDASSQAPGSQGKLMEHWAQLHDTIRHDTAPAPPRRPKQKRKTKFGKVRCIMSGRCVCCQAGKHSIGNRLQDALKVWFPKGGLGRECYSLTAAVFCLSRHGVPDDYSR